MALRLLFRASNWRTIMSNAFEKALDRLGDVTQSGIVALAKPLVEYFMPAAAHAEDDYPTPEQVREARMRAGLTQSQAATLVHRKELKRWSEWELGVRRMQPDTWELFLLLTNQHPTKTVVPKSAG
jgi:hypothetical protein